MDFFFQKERQHKAYEYSRAIRATFFIGRLTPCNQSPLHLKHTNALHLMVLSLLTLLRIHYFLQHRPTLPQGFHLAIKSLNPQNYIKKSLTANFRKNSFPQAEGAYFYFKSLHK